MPPFFPPSAAELGGWASPRQWEWQLRGRRVGSEVKRGREAGCWG